MKKSIVTILFTLFIAVFAASPLLAANSAKKVKLDIYNEVKVADVTLAPGTYTFAVTVNGDEATVEIAKGKKVVATMSGNFKADKKFGYDLALLSSKGVASGLEGDSLKGTITFTGKK